MSRVPYTPEQLKKLGLIQVGDVYVKAESQVAKGKVEKIKLPADYLPFKNVGVAHPDGNVEPVIKPSVAIKEFIEKGFKDIKPNAKIRNATKSEVDGVKFDSRLEKYMYDLLTGAKIDFQFQVEYLLQEKFRYRGEAIRAITLTVDFVLESREIIIDTKGFQTQQGTMRYKLLKKLMARSGKAPEIILPSNKKECDELLNRLLYDH